MTQTIKLKNSGTSSNTPSSLEHGELAINYADGKIFYKNSSNSIVEFANLSGSFLPLSGGTLTGGLSGTSATFSGSVTSTGLTVSGGTINLGSDSVASTINSLGDVFVLDVDSNANTGGTPNIQFKVSGSEKMRLTSTGLGIGITNPTEKFTVVNASSGIVGRFTNNIDQTLDLGVIAGSGANGGVYYSSANSGYHSFQIGTTERFKINADGSSVFSGTISSGAITVNHTDGTNNISLTPTSTGGVINARNSSGTSVVVMDGRGTPFIDVAGNLKTGGTTRIDSSGNLSSIGTISSGAITSTGLEVNGSRYFDGDYNITYYRKANHTTLGYQLFRDNGISYYEWNSGGTHSHDLQFLSNNSPVMQLSTSYNVNIPNGGLAIAKTSAPDALLDIDTGSVSPYPSARFRRNHGAQAFQQLSGLSFYWNTSNGLQDNTIVYGASANSNALSDLSKTIFPLAPVNVTSLPKVVVPEISALPLISKPVATTLPEISTPLVFVVNFVFPA